VHSSDKGKESRQQLVPEGRRLSGNDFVDQHDSAPSGYATYTGLGL